MRTEVENVIAFADPAVEAICLANWDTNGDGYFMKSEAQGVTSIGAKFTNNTEINSFDEFQHFKNVTKVYGYTGVSTPNGFTGCTNLTSIVLPEGISIENGTWGNDRYGAFYKTSLVTVGNLDKVTSRIGSFAFLRVSSLSYSGKFSPNITTIGESAFEDCTKFNADVDLPNLTSVGREAFGKSGITRISNLGTITTIPTGSWYSRGRYGVFSECVNLVFAELPSTLTSIGDYAFWNCSALETLICRATTPPTMSGSNTFVGTTCNIYVPDDSVNAYKEATGWASLASRIKPLSEYTE